MEGQVLLGWVFQSKVHQTIDTIDKADEVICGQTSRTKEHDPKDDIESTMCTQVLQAFWLFPM